MVTKRHNPFRDQLKRLPHKAILRREAPFRQADRREMDEAAARFAAGAEHVSYAGGRGDEIGCTVFCFDTAAKAHAFQVWLDEVGMADRPEPPRYDGPQMKVG